MKNKILNFIVTLFLVLTGATCLTACGGGDGEPKLIAIEASHKNSIYDFELGVDITYDENLTFASNDFTLLLKYDDGSSNTIDSGYSLEIYKLGESETLATELLPGNYRLDFGYEELSFSLYLTISPIELDANNLTISGLRENYTYSSEGIYDFSGVTFIYNNETALVKDTDYTLDYTITGYNSATGTGEGFIQCGGQGIYSGGALFYFDIVGKNIDVPTFKDTYTIAYDGQTHSNDIVDDVDISSLVGIRNISYTFQKDGQLDSYSWIEDAGTYTATAHFEVEYGYMPVADKTFTVVIEQLDINTLNISSSIADIDVKYKNDAYTASDIAYILTNLSQDITYNINMLSGVNIDNTNASTSNTTGKFEIVGTGNYTGTIEVSFTISPVSISNRIQVDSQVYTYNGSEQFLQGSVYCYVNYNNIVLVKDNDYTIVYSNNTNAGNASYTITGIGNYTGTYIGSFTIDKQVIYTSDYNFNWNTNISSLTYNGEEQEFVTLDIPSNSDILKLAGLEYKAYTDYTYTSPTILQNAGTYYYRAEFTLNDVNNYMFYGNTDNTWAVSYGHVEIAPAQATLSYTGSTSFEYTGNPVVPDGNLISVAAKLSNKDVNLIKGTDYSLSFNNSAINVIDGSYAATATLTNTNYYFDMNGVNYDYNTYIWYTITPKTLAEGDLTITLPTITQIVWGDYELKTTAGNAKYGDIDIPLTFDVYFDGSEDLVWKLSTELDTKNYECTIATKHITGANADAELTAKIELENRYFSKVAINGTSLTDKQIQDLISTGVNIGDQVEIVCNEGYKIDYYSNESSLTFIAGTEKDEDNNYLFETSAYIYIYEQDSSISIVSGIIKINRDNVFESFTIGATDMIISNWANMKSQTAIYLNGETPEIVIKCKEGYKASVEVVNNDDTPDTVCEKGQTCNYTVTSSIKSVTIKIFRGTNTDAFLEFNYTVES